MNVTMLKGKIHRAVVRQAELNYVGSITIDPVLMKAANILEYEQVQIVDVENGSGMICLNGAAARCVQPGDHVIIMCYCSMTEEEAEEYRPRVVFVDEKNKIYKETCYEKHGQIEPPVH